MKKLSSVLLALSLSALALTGCGSSTDTSADTSAEETTTAADAETEAAADEATADGDNVIKVGATSTPHGEILEFVRISLLNRAMTSRSQFTMTMYFRIRQ